MLMKALQIIKKFFIILWHERKTKPLNIILLSFRRYHQGGRKEVTKGINNRYKSLDKQSNQKKELYEKWIKENEVNILEAKTLSYEPLISIIVPTYNTEKKYLIKMLDSVFNQTYLNWQLCIADDASSNLETIKVLEKYEKKHHNIDIVFRKINGHISEASNSALSLAKGEYITLLDHDDMLAPNALYEMVKKLNKNRELKLIYSDEDKVDEKDQRFDPHFKSGWNLDMFFSQNYLCHLVLLKRDMVEDIGGFRKGYEGSQDYDLLLRYISQIKYDEIDRVQKILYHWRAIKGSTAYASNQKSYTEVSGLKALDSFFSSQSSKVIIEKGLAPNTYKVNYSLPEKSPLVSLIIPTRDGYNILQQCINSILKKTSYLNYEIIIIDNESSEKKTLEYFKKLDQYGHIKIIKYPYPFNYSAINNYAVTHANGEYILFLNNDVEIISLNWIEEMLQHAMRDDIGVVGAKLFYDDGTIQHAGIILGIGAVAGHSHKYFQEKDYGYFSRLKIIQNYSAVTGACMLVSKDIFKEVEGLTEDLAVAFNDVDFCLKVQEKGYRNVWTPYAKLFHHESKTRGRENTPKKALRFNEEIEFMTKKWNLELIQDKFYNENLSLAFEDFGIKIKKNIII